MHLAVTTVVSFLLVCASAFSQIQQKPESSKGAVWITQTTTGGIAGGSRRIVVNLNGEVQELQMSPGREKSNSLGKLDEAGKKELTDLIADAPRFVAPEKDGGKVVDGQTFEIRVKDDQRAIWYTATPDTPERIKKLSAWLTDLPGRMKPQK